MVSTPPAKSKLATIRLRPPNNSGHFNFRPSTGPNWTKERPSGRIHRATAEDSEAWNRAASAMVSEEDFLHGVSRGDLATVSEYLAGGGDPDGANQLCIVWLRLMRLTSAKSESHTLRRPTQHTNELNPGRSMACQLCISLPSMDTTASDKS